MGAADMPAEPMTATAEGAATLHEMYVSFQAAGFTKYEALEMTKAFFVAGALQGAQQVQDGSEQ